MKAKNSRSKQEPQTSSDDSGCVILLLLLFWYFGFISFHSRETGRAIERLGDVKAEVSKAQAQLSELSRVLGQMKIQSDSLNAQRDSLRTQVAKLEAIRDEIAANLNSATKAVSSPQRSRLKSLLEFLFNGVPGNIVAAIILAAVGLLYRHAKTGRIAKPSS